ncbi:MAG: acyl-CoA dehydrogenase family protein [Planctomycetota bacterium]
MNHIALLYELTASARAFARTHAHGLEARDIASEDVAARAALARLASGELLQWAVPQAFGGAHNEGISSNERVSVRALCAVRCELAYASGMLDVVFVEQGLGSYAIALGGSDALRHEVLPAVVRGERVAAFALTEDGAGSDLARVALEARPAPGGGYTLHGHKTYITNAGIADFYTVLARTSGAPGEGEGATMFYVPATAPGLSVERFEVTAPHPIGRVFFDGVYVPDAAVLGEVGRGIEVAFGTLSTFRTSVAAAACGFARRALDESVAHLTQREQFGRPLSSFQGLRFDLAEMDTRLRAAELLVDEAARAVDAGRPARSEVARAKLFATETASWICDRAVQHHGGSGVRRGSIVEALWRDVRALRIYEGTSEVQKLILAKEVLAAQCGEGP